MIIWVELEATEPVTLTIGGAQPALVGRHPMPPNWAQVPQAVKGKLEVTMEVKPPSAGGSVEYRFECTGENGEQHESDWVTTLRHTDRKLLPNKVNRYRVKARNRYLQETDWSTVRSVRTGEMPAGVIWRLTEDKGKNIPDTGGRHTGSVQGRADWVTDRYGTSLRFDGKTSVVLEDGSQLPTSGDFTWAAWIKTQRGGTVVARAGRAEEWEEGGKVLFVADGRLVFDVGWVGAIESSRVRLDDSQWHHVAVTVHRADGASDVTLFADGRRVGKDRLQVDRFSESNLPLKIGYCNKDFPPRQPGFVGRIQDVRWYGYRLTGPMITDLSRRENDSPGLK